MKSVEISEIQGVIELIDDRAADLTMTWNGEKKEPTPEIRQALFELAWMRESLEELISNAEHSQSQ